MRKVDFGESFRDGLEFVPSGEIRLGRVTSVYPEGLSVQGPDGQPIVIAPPRTVHVSWLDNPGGRSYVPFVEDWGTVSVPPIGSLVAVSFGIKEKPFVLGFMIDGYKTRISKGELGDLLPGEEVKFRRGYRLRVLSDLDDMKKTSGSSSDYEIDMAVGDLTKSVIGEQEDLKAEAGIIADSVVASIVGVINSFIDEFSTPQLFAETGFDFNPSLKKTVKDDLKRYTESYLYLSIIKEATAFLTVDIKKYFLNVLTIFVNTRKFEPSKDDEQLTVTFISDLERFLREKISFRIKTVFPELQGWLTIPLEARAKGSLAEAGIIIEDRVRRYVQRKFETYVATKVSSKLKGAVSALGRRTLKFVRNNLIKDIRLKIRSPFLKQAAKTVGDFEKDLEDIAKQIRAELVAGKIIDPAPTLLFYWNLKSKRDDDNFATVNVKVYSNGQLQLTSSNAKGETFNFRSSEDGHVELECPSLTLISDDIRLGSENAEKAIAVDRDAVKVTDELKNFILNHTHLFVGTGTVSGPNPVDTGRLVSLLSSGKMGEVQASTVKSKAE